jgi:hypothetical protein
MIYKLYCGLIMSGYAACSTLLGGYMMHYGGAREVDLGFIFMLQPMTIFLRPFICAHSDRRQIHRQMLAFFATLTALAYVPFIVYPFFFHLLNWDTSTELELDETDPRDMAEVFVDQQAHERQQRIIFWLLMLFHLIGSIGFCGVRSLGDALACNYAKRTGTDFARFRKYGSMSYGVCNFLLGFINQDWLVPNFVPALAVYSGSMLLLAFLVFNWPHEYFIMSCQDNEDEQAQRDYIESLPDLCECLQHVASRICCCCGVQPPAPRRPRPSVSSEPTPAMINRFLQDEAAKAPKSVGGNQLTNKLATGAVTKTAADGQPAAPRQPGGRLATERQLTIGQQVRIFGLLLRRDFRVMLYLLIIFYGGLTGYSGPNFVFTYINLVCQQRGTCKGSELSGLVMLGYCFVETSVYMIVDRWGHRFNRTMALDFTFLVLAFHYCFYGFALDYLSPYFFLVESLHGIEYGISLTMSVNLGYYFAREVELLLPELLARRIVSENDDLELVKVSLMATMSGCYTLAYDGIGCILGCLLFGLVLANFGFNVMWISIGFAALLGFLVIALGYTLGKCFGVRPEILRIRDRQLAEQRAEHDGRQVGA